MLCIPRQYLHDLPIGSLLNLPLTVADAPGPVDPKTSMFSLLAASTYHPEMAADVPHALFLPCSLFLLQVPRSVEDNVLPACRDRPISQAG
jgi:hypothetical protein